MPDDLDRLFERLVRVLAEDAPGRLAVPFPAAEVYERLVPYRSNRSTLKVATHQDYEMAVLRLLSGERGYVSLDPGEVQEALRRETAEVNPEPEPARRRALPARRPGVRAAPRAVARRPGARETGGGDGSGSGRRSRRSDPPIGICVRAGGAERVPAPVSLLRRNAPRGAEGELLPPVRPAAVGRAALSRVWQ